jgi:CheY-like chemotaxis protein
MPHPGRADAVSLPSFLPRGVAVPGIGALPLSGLTFLVVEDSRFSSDALRMLCQRSGARLRRAETMEQARAHLRTYCPDVVVVDLGLPDGRGDQLIRELVAGQRPILVLGMSGDPDGRAFAMQAGAAGFLDKPFVGVGAFQRSVLRHLPGRFAPTQRDDDLTTAPDLLALHDDLARAALGLSDDMDASARCYFAGFVAGVARSAGDSDLAAAAGAAARTADALPGLQSLVQRRLNEGVSF